MKTIIADAAWDGRRLTRFLQKALPAASMGQIARFLRLGRVKVDGRRGHEDTVLGKAGTKLRGHEFHFSQDEAEGESPFRFKKLRTGECY